MEGETEKINDDVRLRLSCISMAVKVVNADGKYDKDNVVLIAKEMYEWVKNG